MSVVLNDKLLEGKNYQDRVVIFDFGGVISKTLFETHRLTEAALGLTSGTLQWQGPFDPTTDSLWAAMQKDEITERNYWEARTREVAAIVGESWTTMKEFVVAARGADPASVIREEALLTFLILKKVGCRMAILSNELDLFYGAEFRQKLPFMADFEVIVDATYTKILKPDPKAYQLCLDELAVPASSCIFVDDQARNIQGAVDLGLTTVHFDVCSPLTSFQKILNKLATLS